MGPGPLSLLDLFESDFAELGRVAHAGPRQDDDFRCKRCRQRAVGIDLEFGDGGIVRGGHVPHRIQVKALVVSEWHQTPAPGTRIMSPLAGTAQVDARAFGTG
jgi:hypothetical protein